MKDEMFLCSQYITIFVCGPRPSTNEQGKNAYLKLNPGTSSNIVQICLANLLRRYSNELHTKKVFIYAIHHRFCIMFVPVDM